MANVLITLHEDRPATTANHFAVIYSVDENDCFEMAQGMSQLGHDVFFVNWADFDGQEFTRMFNYNRRGFVRPLELADFALAFVYKMEGFLFDLPRFFGMVRRIEQQCYCVLNRPATIAHNADKRYMWELEREGVRIIPTYPLDSRAEGMIADGQPLVLKPIFGERGYGAVLARTPEDISGIKGKPSEYIAQKYMSEIRAGERSLMFVGPEFHHAVIKKPAPSNPDEFRCNMSLGGTVEVYSPTREELTFAENVLQAYTRLGYEAHFSRIDVIATDEGPTLMEAELLNPSMYANYSQVGPQFGMAVARYFDSVLAGGQRSPDSVAGFTPPARIFSLR
jgi:glutathione synthase/RimK-type ligase-like ATP-grasp enzyme